MYISTPPILVGNIEWAFKVWREQPWGKNVSFEQFCEYVLPYRVGNEKLEPWRERLYYQFMPIIEKHKNDPEIENPVHAAFVVRDSLLRTPHYFTGEMGTSVRVGLGLRIGGVEVVWIYAMHWFTFTGHWVFRAALKSFL